MDDSHASPLEPRIIPISPNFPIRWEVPEDERMPWQLDPMHFPDPMPRWENELYCEMADMGTSPATFRKAIYGVRDQWSAWGLDKREANRLIQEYNRIYRKKRRG